MNIALHEQPAWREKANFVMFADVTESASGDRWEQMWGRQVTDDTFELCCIPFFTYGLSLGDVVRTKASKGKRFVVADVVRKSGRSVVRLWLGKAGVGLEDVLKELSSLDVAFEVSGRHPVVVSVEPGQAHDVARWTANWAEPNGVLVEDG